MKEELIQLENQIKKHFASEEYILNNPVKIASGIDKSVTFIGSGISVLKTKLLHDSIFETGEFIIQRAIRTQALKNLETSSISEWSSYFNAFCALVTYDKLEKIISDTLTLLTKTLKIDIENILIRVNSKDMDFIEILTTKFKEYKLEIDSKEISYYRHKYGLDDLNIYGRNFNIAIRDQRIGDFRDIGNIIIIESKYKKYGVESALGLNAILMRLLGKQNSIETSSIVDIVQCDSPEKIGFLDCLSVVSHLLYEYEEIKQSKKRYPEYWFRKYLRMLVKLSKELGYGSDDVITYIHEYILLEYQCHIVIPDNIFNLLTKY